MPRRVAPDLRPIRHKTLNELEGVGPRERPPDGTIERRFHDLRRLPIGELAPADLRFLIRWRQGIRYLVPLAVERLEADPLLETVYGPGDLLESVLEAEPHWAGRIALQDLRTRARALVEKALARLAATEPDEEFYEDDRKRLEPLLREALRKLA